MKTAKLLKLLPIAFATTALVNLGLPILDVQLNSSNRVLAQTTSALKAEADRLFQQGGRQYRTGQFEAALRSWQQALAISQKIKDRGREAAALELIGTIYLFQRDYTRASNYMEQSLAIARAIHDRQGEEQALQSLLIAYYALGDYTRAIEYQQQS